MAIAASGDGGALVRVDPNQSAELVATTGARVAEMRGRAMSGWLRLDAADLHDERLARWVDIGRSCARSLPAKT